MCFIHRSLSNIHAFSKYSLYVELHKIHIRFGQAFILSYTSGLNVCICIFNTVGSVVQHVACFAYVRYYGDNVKIGCDRNSTRNSNDCRLLCGLYVFHKKLRSIHIPFMGIQHSSFNHFLNMLMFDEHISRIVVYYVDKMMISCKFKYKFCYLGILDEHFGKCLVNKFHE